MIRRFSIGYDVELHKRTLERGLLSLLGPRRRRRRRRRRLPAPSTRTRSLEIDGHRRPARSAPTSASTCCATRPTPRRWWPALREAGARAGLRGGRRVPADRARPPALRRRPRRHGDPPGGGSQRARGVVHQGLLRRPGDGRAAVLPRQAQPPPARPAAAPPRLATGDEIGFGGRAVGRLGSVADSPRSARSRWRSSAARRRPGSTVPVGRRRITRDVVELPFELTGDERSPARRVRRCGRSDSCGMSGCEASQVPTIRTSSISSGGTWAPSSPAAAGARQRRGRARSSSSEVVRASGPQSTSRPPTIQKASKRRLGRVRGQHQPRARVGRLEHAAEPVEDDAQPPRRRRSARGALVALLGRRRAHLRLDVLEQPLAARRRSSTNSRSASSSRRRYRFGSRSPRHGDRQRPICP